MSYFTRNMDKCSRSHSFPVTRYIDLLFKQPEKLASFLKKNQFSLVSQSLLRVDLPSLLEMHPTLDRLVLDSSPKLRSFASSSEGRKEEEEGVRRGALLAQGGEIKVSKISFKQKAENSCHTVSTLILVIKILVTFGNG